VNPWERPWGSDQAASGAVAGADAPAADAPSTKVPTSVGKPWERKWGEAAKPEAKAEAKPSSPDLALASGGLKPGEVPEASAGEAAKLNVFTNFLSKESARPRFNPDTGEPEKPTFQDALESARLKSNFFSSVAEGFSKLGRKYAPKMPEALGGVDLDTIASRIRTGLATPAETFTYNNLLKDLVDGYKISAQEDHRGFAEALEGTLSAAIDNPGNFAGQLVAGLIQDPEMLALGGMGTGSKLAGMVKQYKKAAEAAGVGAEATAGGALMSAAGQYADRGEVRLPQLASEAVQIGLPMGMIHAVKGLRAKPGEEPATKPATEEDFPDSKSFKDYLETQVDEHVAKAQQRIEPGPLKPVEVATPERPFSDAKKWETSRLERIRDAAELRIAESKAKFESSKATDRRRRMKSLGTEEQGEHAQRLEDQLKQIKDELAERKGEGPSAGVVAGAALGATAAALAMANPDVRDKASTGAIVAAVFLGMPEGSRALSPVLKAAERSGRVLERLNERSPGKTEFKKVELLSEINRQDVPKAEKEALQRVIEQFPGESVKSADLVHHFQLETQNFELKPETTQRYAPLGLDRVDRGSYGVKAQTDVWKLPESWNIPAKGHFEAMGPNQYGHTRSFVEGDVRHVVEMQSDLQQHLAPMSEDQIKAENTSLSNINTGIEVFNDLNATIQASPTGLRSALSRWPAIWRGLGWEPRGAFFSWVNESTPSLEKTALQRLDPEGRKQEVSGAHEAISAVYDNKMKELQYNVKAKGYEQVKGYRIVPRKIQVKTGTGLRSEVVSDAWDVVVDYQPRDFMNREDSGPARQAIEHVDSGSILYNLVNQGWVPHDFGLTLRAAVETLNMKRDETSARLGNEPAKAELRERIRPIGEKIWPRRLIQEEIARASREGRDKIRFGDAEVVARIEGWQRRTAEWKNVRKTLLADPDISDTDRTTLEAEMAKLTDSFVSPKHQSIYDRYRDEITKYLKSLGAKEVTDQFGHTWHEVSVRSGVPKRVFGASDPRYLAKLAALGVGAAAGAYFSTQDKKLIGAIEGTLGAAALVMFGPGLAAVVKDMRTPDTRIRITHIGDDHEELVHRLAIHTMQEQTKVENLVPRIADREHLTAWLRGDRSKPLNAEQQKALPIIRQWFQIAGGLQGRTAKAAASRFARSSANMKDISAVMGAFGHAVARSIADTRMLDALETTKDPAGNGLITSPQKAPAGYVHLEHPLLSGYSVHPDIATSLRLMLDTPHPVAAKRVAWALMQGTKRALVSFSLFHATALSFASQAASSNPVKFIKLYAQAVAPRVFGENLLIKAVREQGHGAPIIDDAIKGGLTWSLGRETGGVEDVGNFYAGMHDIAKLAESVPVLGQPLAIATRSLIKLNQKFDGFMWDRLHAGMKLDLFAEKFQQLLENNARAIAKDPKIKALSRRQAATIAAQYSNAIFGGLNWRRAAESVQSRLLRDVTSKGFSPWSRRIAQVALFAPDWLVSTATPWFVAAFGKGTGIKGVLNAQTLADLHRQYLIRSGLFYLVVGDAINHAMSGHHIWDNKNPLQIDLDPQGERHMIFNKHLLEVPHMLQDPTKQILGKLSFPVKESLNQLFGTEYLSIKTDPRTGQVSAGPAMEGSRLGHAARGLEPIAVQQGFGGGADAGMAGFFGLPVYGRTREQKLQDAAERRRKRVRQHIDQLLSR
jgi:hypothetical protein